MRVLGFVLASVLCLSTGTAVIASEGERLVSVTGQGQVMAEPDMATIRIGVTHEDTEAKVAMAQTAEGAANVLARLEEAGLDPRDVQTGSVSLNPVWSNRGSSNEPARITGFAATISVTARVRDLDSLGGVLDAVIEDGANQLGGIQFGIQDPKPLMEQARRNAVADGRAKADVLAEAAGITLGPLQSMSEGGVSRPQGVMATMEARDASVPIAAGELTLSATVSMVYQIAE